MPAKVAAISEADELVRRNRELTILNQVAEALNHEVDLDQALRTALAKVAEFFGLHTGWTFLLHEETDEAYLAAAQNLPPALAQDSCQLMEGDCTCLDAYRKGGLDNRERVSVITCSRLDELMDGTNGLRYHASIPLYAHQKPLGVLNVASAEAHWWELSPADLRLLHTVGELLSIAVERARLFARSTQLGVIEERNRLAREIHDTLAQGLTAVALKLETADALLEAALLRQVSSQSQASPAVEPLTPREQEVLHLLAQGLQNKEIAAQLVISQRTVKFHVSSIMTKLGASNRIEVVRLAAQQGLIEL
jgi:two-component system NarL family sensor kinase